MERGLEFGRFLRSRRARLQPEEVGLPPNLRPRRVTGLRRQEVAQLAGVSIEYYTRLEQGRAGNVSESVLAALARALRLDPTERAHLFDLGRMRIAEPIPGRPQRVRPGWYRLLDSLAAPAFVLGRRLDVLATNALARELLTDFEALPATERNYAKFVLLDPLARERYPDWEEVAIETVAVLRLDAGRHPGDRLLTELVDCLSLRSPEFVRWWADRRVSERSRGTKRYRHPVVGELVLDYEALTSPDDPDQSLFVYSAEPGSRSAAVMCELQQLVTERRFPVRARAGNGGHPAAAAP